MVRRNIIANLTGRGLAVALNVLLLPVLLSLLGADAVGLIGFYGTLATIVGALDHAFGPIIMREVARSGTDPDSVQRQRDFLRTSEVLYGAAALGIGLLITGLASRIAHRWLSGAALTDEIVLACVVLMGWTVVLQLGVGLHLSMLNGLERQLRSNVISTSLAVARGAIAVIVLLTMAATTKAYFLSQLVVTAFGLTASFVIVWRAIPAGARPCVRPRLVAEAWAQAPALTGTALVFVLLIQADRLMVSALLPLDALGYYVIASSVAGVTFSFHGAIAVALVPRFTKMLVAGAEDELADLFHLASQFTTLMLAPFTAITVLHGETLLLLWTGNPVAASHASLPLALLSLGAFMLSMTCVSCSLQLAAGLVRFGLIANLLSISALPLAYVAIGQWGASGAAVVWVMMGAIHLVLTPILLHHQLLASELARWYLRDLVVPSAAALVIGFLAWRIFGMPQSRVGMGALLLLTWSAASAAAFAASPLLWRLLRDWYRSGKGLRWGWVP